MKALSILFIIALLIFGGVTASFYLPEEVDVVVIGAGAAGMSAALACHEETGSLVVLEKMPYAGGNSSRASAGFNAAVSMEDVEPYISDTGEAGRYAGDPVLIRTMVEGSWAVLSELKNLGADLSDQGLLAGHSERRTFRPSGGKPVGLEVSGVLFRELERQGIDLRTENRALHISQERKGLLVRVENRTGRVYSIRAGAVIIATGGFGGSPEMVARANPSLKGFNSTNAASASGDFVALTEDLPTVLINMGDIQIHPTVEPDFGILISEALRGNGGILLNKSGRRFTNEMRFREPLSRSILDQEGGEAWLVFDQGIRESLQAVEYYFDQELVRQGNSFEELAEELGIPPARLRDALEDWNRAIALGRDAAFGRKDLNRSLFSPPYYAVNVRPGIHYCMGGLHIDRRARVLDMDGNPIPGLYAAGEATGGIHGRDRLGGNSLTDAMVFGQIAGREASALTKKRP
jgi:fumarate reductase flavoprotein subunit